jgi:predicted amidohydrolase
MKDRNNKQDVVKVSLAQSNAIPGDKRGNLDKAKQLILQAHKKGADLIVFPELYLTGYALENMERFFDLAETIPGRSIEELLRYSKKYNIYIIWGMPAQDPITPYFFYNASVLLGPEGVCGTYYKTHLATFPYVNGPGGVCAEGAYFKPGNEISVFPTRIGRIGICICYDLRFPEVSRILALKGAEIIVCIAAADLLFEEGIRNTVQTRARENFVYYIYVNYTGTQAWPKAKFFGEAMIFDPYGIEVVKGSLNKSNQGKEELIVADLDLKKVNQARKSAYSLRDRRPEIYKYLCEGK